MEDADTQGAWDEWAERQTASLDEWVSAASPAKGAPTPAGGEDELRSELDAFGDDLEVEFASVRDMMADGLRVFRGERVELREALGREREAFKQRVRELRKSFDRDALRDKVKEEHARMKGRLVAEGKRMTARVSARLEQQRLVVEARLREEPVIKWVDKFTFFCGVVGVLIIEAAALGAPETLPSLYTWTIIPLVVWRYLTYHASRQHYFTIDFCYFANVLLLLSLHAMPESEGLFACCFWFANGPLLWGVPLWGNSMTFHSLDKMTSCAIHLLPALVTWHLRHGGPHRTIDLENTSEWVLAFGFYATWQVLYLAKVMVSRKVIEEEGLWTSLKWLSKSMRKTVLYKVLDAFGPRFHTPMFVLLQFAYTVLTSLPVPLLWHSSRTHAGLLALITAIAIWNGAGFYIHKFASAQARELERKTASAAAPDAREPWVQRYIRRGGRRAPCFS